jgi:hypothetical protein
MNTRVNGLNETRRSTLLACFGPARLVELPDGRLELRGGSSADVTEAKEWMSLFLHDRVLRLASAPGSQN